MRVDYLAPTLYVTDLFFLSLCIVFWEKLKKFIQNNYPLILIFLSFVFIHAGLSSEPILSLYGWAKIIQMLLLFAIVKHNQNKNSLLLGLACATILQFILVLLQLFFRHSLQGMWYFLGERAISLSSIDAAKVIMADKLLLRPYGTFSHPNSLSGFFLLWYVYLLAHKPFSSFFRLTLMTASSLMVFFSFSKNAVFAYVLVNLLYVFFSTFTRCKICTFAKIIMLTLLLSIFLSTQTDNLSFKKRFLLLDNSVAIIKNHLLVGVGMKNYIIAQSPLPTPFPYMFYQPVHNIMMLYLAETGLLGMAILLFSVWWTIRFHKANKSTLLLVAVILLTGMFDHYWLTLQQNMMVASVLLSLSVS